MLQKQLTFLRNCIAFGDFGDAAVLVLLILIMLLATYYNICMNFSYCKRERLTVVVDENE